MRKILVIAFCIIGVVSIYAKNNARADIYFVNGKKLENIEMKFPGSWHTKVEYLIDGKKNKTHVDSIDHILIYHVDAPERKAYLKYNSIGKFDNKKNEIVDWNAKNWQVLESAGENLEYWVSFYKVKVLKDGFRFNIGAYEGCYTTPYYFKKPTDPIAFNIPSNPYRPGATRDWLVAYLADDPEIVKRISEKGYYSMKQSLRNSNVSNPFFYEDIAVEYNPKI